MIYLTKTDFLVLSALYLDYKAKNFLLIESGLNYSSLYSEISIRCKKAIKDSIDSLIFYKLVEETRLKSQKLNYIRAFVLTDKGIKLSKILED